jgi:hypothetical protein
MGDFLTGDENRSRSEGKHPALHAQDAKVMPSGGRGLETARGRVRSSLPYCEGADRRGTVQCCYRASYVAQSTGPESNVE